MVPESRFVSIRRLPVCRDYTVIGHFKDPYKPISIMESHKGFVDDSEIREKHLVGVKPYERKGDTIPTTIINSLPLKIGQLPKGKDPRVP